MSSVDEPARRSHVAWQPIIVLVFAWLSLAAGPASQPVVQPSPDTPAPAPSTAPITGPMTDLSNDEFHFHLKYPAGWKRLDPPVNHQVISLQTAPANPGDTNFAAIGLRIQSSTAGASDDRILKDISGEMVSYAVNHGGKKVTVNPAQLGDIPARRLIFDVEAGNTSSRVMCIIAVREKVEYVFTIAAPAETLDRTSPGIDAMLGSFSLTD